MSRRRKQNAFRNGQFTPQYERILRSPAYRDLSCKARCLLLEFERLCFPYYRNGQLSISTYKAAELLNINPDTASKAFYELVEHGFLILKRESMWQERMAREWILTTYPYNGAEKPTDDWMRWEPQKPVRVIPKKSSTAESNQKKSRSQFYGQRAGKSQATLHKSSGQSHYSNTLLDLLDMENQ